MNYDAALKRVLKRLTGNVLAALTGFAIERWHNVEVPMIRELRMDMLGETSDGKLVHIELQSTNDPEIPLRMAEYALAIFREFERMPEQIVLYAGPGSSTMKNRLDGPTVSFHYRLIDISDLDSEPLLASPHLDDNVIAILTRLRNKRAAVRKILGAIAQLGPARRAVALEELLILAGLRRLGATIREETKRMPILTDIMEHDLFGPAIRQGREEGREEGLDQGQRRVIARQIEKRFGTIPAWAAERLEKATAPEIESLALRLLDAADLKELFL